jgi:hypothetical protein
MAWNKQPARTPYEEWGGIYGRPICVSGRPWKPMPPTQKIPRRLAALTHQAFLFLS